MSNLEVISNQVCSEYRTPKIICTHEKLFAKNSLPSFIEHKIETYEQRLFSSTKNGKHLVLGKFPSTDAIMLQSNDYLSLAKHPCITEAQINSLNDFAQATVMSAVFLHEDSSKDRFEAAIASYAGYEKSILSQSGWAANVGLMQVIAGDDTNVYIDFLAHMSLWEGIKSSGANALPFKHNNIKSLENLIKKHGKGIIVVDSIYSTIGDVCPLFDIVDVATRYGCALVVDESHSLGTHGPGGAGLVAEFGLSDQVHFVTASLAKTFAARAGILFCSERVAKCFPYIAHPAIFSSTLLPYEIAGLMATLDLILKSDERRKKLHRNATYFREGLISLGYAISSKSQIVALEGGREEATEQIRDALEAKNIFGSVFCAPATPKKRSLIRLSLNSDLSLTQLDQILSACADLRSSNLIKACF